MRSWYYDKLRTSAPYNKCPFCGLGQVANLDHFLSKADFPALSVLPVNLVPICRDCNMGEKGRQALTCYHESHIHPYYDDINQEVWLKVEINEESQGYVPLYYTEKPTTWDSLLYTRVENHFKIFGLNKRFADLAADEINNMKHCWIEINKKDGLVGLKKHIEGLLNSIEKIALNGWKQALYRELKGNDDCLTYLVKSDS